MEKLKQIGDDKLIRESSWDGDSLSFEKDRAYGFSWPQRNYRCSFCKKEFKSAQALGGHMNIHRRDRARMRLSSPSSSWDSSTMYPNPNPNPSLHISYTSPAPKFLPFSYKTSHCSSNSVSMKDEKVSVFQHSTREKDDGILIQICGGDLDDNRGKKNKGNGVVDFTSRKDARVCKGTDFVRLDLNMGLIQDPKKDLDLDLELRLGCLN